MGLNFSLLYVNDGQPTYVLQENITHNLTIMAEAAGIYDVLWHPEVIHAKDLVETLEEGLAKLEKTPEFFKTFDSPNGWGKYIHFVPFVRKVLAACKKYPNSIIEVLR